jgi:uncharacterized protein
MRLYRLSILVIAALCSLDAATSAEAESVVTVRIAGIHSAAGRVVVALCADPAGGFPGACITHSGNAPAKAGEVLIGISRVPDGRYAVQAFHDENGDFRPQIPPEGYAFGNGSGWPVSFDAAAVQVKGDTEIGLKMEYVGSAPSAPAQAHTPTLQLPDGVTAVDLRTNGLYGTLFMPAGRDKRPALLLIGGSEGGLDTISQMATSFAAEGFATLALAYWQAPGLPQTLENIPLEYFDRAVAWLQKHPRVAGGSIGMLGWSRGSEAALLTAVRNPQIRAVIGVAPSGVVWPGLNFRDYTAPKPAWTARGKPLQALTIDTTGYSQGKPLAELFASNFPQLDQHPEAVIPAERIRGGVLLISGGNDLIWPSTRFADRIGARLQSSGFRHEYIHLNYPAAGHAVFVGAPNSPMARSMGGSESYLGGTRQANAAAWAESWPQVLKFLRTQLKADKS